MNDFGKVPPQAIDMEEAVLGALLIESNAIDSVITLLKPDSFYKQSHSEIYKTILDLHTKNSPIDLLTVSEYLRAGQKLEMAGGPIALISLTNKLTSAAHIEYHAKIVHQKYIQREIIRISTELLNKAYDDTNDIAEMFEFAETELLKITGQVHKKEPLKLGGLVDIVIAKIQKIINHEIKLVGSPSGFTKMDRLTGGFKNGELIIIAGRPSMGKSALALQIALNSAELNTPVAFFSLEMSDESLAQRSISGASGKTNVELLEGYCNIEDIIEKTYGLLGLRVFIDDTGGISIAELRSKTRKLMIKENIKMIIVDYLQLMTGDGQSREQEVSKISRSLKAIAKEFNIPVIALSQLSRKPEERCEKRPQLSDLRESGAIEQDADMVCFVYRPAYYGIKSVDIDGTVDTEGIMELIIAKNRNGAIGSFYVSHNKALTKIVQYEKEECKF